MGGRTATRQSATLDFHLAVYISVAHPSYAAFENKCLMDLAERVRLQRAPGFATRFWEQVNDISSALDRGEPEAVFDALKLVGPLAMRPSGSDGTAGDDPFVALRRRVWSQIDAWHEQSRIGVGRETRRIASRNLKRLGSVLAGDRRGHSRTKDIPARHVWVRYHQTLFRLTRARHLLRVLAPSRSSRRDRERFVAAVCGLPVSLVAPPRDRTTGEVYQWLSPKQLARIDAARRFGIASDSVENRVSGAYRSAYELASPIRGYDAVLRPPHLIPSEESAEKSRK